MLYLKTLVTKHSLRLTVPVMGPGSASGCGYTRFVAGMILSCMLLVSSKLHFNHQFSAILVVVDFMQASDIS